MRENSLHGFSSFGSVMHENCMQAREQKVSSHLLRKSMNKHHSSRVILQKHLVLVGQHNTHTYAETEALRTCLCKGKYTEEADVRYLNHSNGYNFEKHLEGIVENSFRLYISTKKNPTKWEQVRWLIEAIGKNTPVGTAGLETKKQHSDTEEAELSGTAVDWKGRIRQRDTINQRFIFYHNENRIYEVTFWGFSS